MMTHSTPLRRLCDHCAARREANGDLFPSWMVDAESKAGLEAKTSSDIVDDAVVHHGELPAEHRLDKTKADVSEGTSRDSSKATKETGAESPHRLVQWLRACFGCKISLDTVQASRTP